MLMGSCESHLYSTAPENEMIQSNRTTLNEYARRLSRHSHRGEGQKEQ